jgi:hypothetical protein
MREKSGIGFTAAAGLFGVCTALLLRHPRPATLPRWTEPPARPQPRGLGQVRGALWEADGWRIRARAAIESERAALEAWDPRSFAGAEEERWRQETLARDPRGYLRRARAAAARAAAGAHSREEAANAAGLRALIEHEAGDHREELRQARLLMALAPHTLAAASTLRRAGTCNRLESELRRAAIALRTLRGDTTSDPVQGVKLRSNPQVDDKCQHVLNSPTTRVIKQSERVSEWSNAR